MPIKYIFSINSGRSGSDYLTELFCHAKNAVSIHEGGPIMNGKEMEDFNDGNEKPMQSLMSTKIKTINKKVKRGEVYCETNHSFIKGFGYLLPDQYISQEEIGVVILKRDRQQVVDSMLRVRDVPGKTTWSRAWYLSPYQKRNVIKAPVEFDSLEARCEWYLEEIEARTEEYKRQFPNIKYFTINIEELNDPVTVNQMFDFFNLEPKESLSNVIGKKLNQRSEFPPLNKVENLKAEQYDDPDTLSSSEKDQLLQNMVNYFITRKRHLIDSLVPDYAMAGTYGPAVNRMVAFAEEELEANFNYRVRYTDMEWILIGELLCKLYPKDVLQLTFERHTEPHIHYSYNFNELPTLPRLWKKLGPTGLWKIAKLMYKAPKADFSHRKDHQPEAVA